MTDITEDVVDRLEYEAQRTGAEPEELTVVVESDIEATEEELQEVKEEKSELEERVEELEDELDDTEAEMEELQEEVDEVSEVYAEALAESTPAFDEDDLVERWDVSELREKYEELAEDEEVEELTASPQSADPGAGEQTPDVDEEGNETTELSEDAQAVVEQLEARAEAADHGESYAARAEEIRENGGL